jgi:ribosome-associated translation inhibitor RaiA
MFTNTKADLGPCNSVHDEKLREQYKQSPDHGKLGYERDFYEKIQRLVADLERTMRKGNDRLYARGNLDLADASRDEFQEKVVLLEKKIAKVMQEIEDAGNSGRIEDAQKAMIEHEKLILDLEQMKKVPAIY